MSSKVVIAQKLDRDSDQTLASQLEEIIRDGIERGTWRTGQAIPSERELSRIYGLSRMTVRRGLDRLVAAGILYRVDGKGTFVSEPKMNFKALSLAGLREQTLEMGGTPAAKLLSSEKIFAPENIAQALEVPPDTPVFLIERLIIVNNVALALNRSYIPANVCPDLLDIDLVNSSLYEVLRTRYGIMISHAKETLESVLASDRESLLLGVAAGSPMLLLRIKIFDAADRIVEYVKVVFRGDKVQLSIDL